MMKKILIAIMVLAALAACNKKPAEQKEQKGAVLAKVGTAVITEGDLARELKSLPDYAQQMFADAGYSTCSVRHYIQAGTGKKQ